MARLMSEDEEAKSFLEISLAGERVLYSEQHWQPVELTLKSGARVLKIAESEQAECLLCREPKDEVEALLLNLRELQAGRLEKLSFEPSEPFFELSIERSARHGLKVEVWLDAGNSETGIYTWDAAGIRFHTTDEHLGHFISNIEKEFA